MDFERYSVHKDKQLWLYEGEGFCIPTYVREIATEDDAACVWIVWPAIDLILDAHRLFYSRLTGSAIAQDGKFLYFDDQNAILNLLRQAYGVTPEFYYHWNGQTMSKVLKENEELPNGKAYEIPKAIDEDFLKEVVSRTQLCSVDAMRVIWRAICQISVEWLLSRRKAINMGFCTLFAVPYRQNWKSILLGAFPKSFSVFSKPSYKQERALLEHGIMDAFGSRQILEVDGASHWYHWKIECVPNTLWDSVVEKVEIQRIAAGKHVYADFIARSIYRHRSLIVAAYRYFVCRSALPCGKFDPMAPEGQQVIIPYTPKGGVRARSLASSSPVICADGTVDYSKPKLSELVEAEIAAVHRLPNVRRQVAELRISRGYIETPRNGEG